LLSVSQLCEICYNYLFTSKGVTVFRRSDGSYAFSGILRGKLYLVDFNPKKMELDKCLIVKTNMGCMWHRRQAYVGMRNLHQIQKEGHILRLINVAFKKDSPCRYPTDRVPLHISLKSRQVVGHASTHCHMLYGSGPRLPVELGSNAATCPMAPDLASQLRWAPTLPRVIWLRTSPLG
jgi:hypothetical protein